MSHLLTSSWRPAHGATVTARGVHFSVWAPHAEHVAVRRLVDDGEVVSDYPLETGPRGTFAGELEALRAGHDYLIVVNGVDARPDPMSRWQPNGVHGASRVVDPESFEWSDADWRGLRAMADYVIYELHVGTFTAAGTFDAVIPILPELRTLGVTAIELMPVAEFPGARNWGYDGVHLFAPESSYGGPAGLRRLVDAAHREGLAVVLDVVYNHLGPEGNYLDRFGPYFTDRYSTPWGRAVNYDGPGSDAVRRHVIDNACYWIAEYHVDALRLDAVHGIFDSSATHVLAELTTAVHALGDELRRSVHVIAESDQNDPRVVRAVHDGGLGFDAQWADDLHHSIHAALTGESSGYYVDYGGLEAVARSLAEPFLYAGQYSPFRDRAHGASAAEHSRDRFVVCVQNHDQVGNRAHGDRLAALVSVPRQRLAAAFALLSPYVPLLFMGEEYGETNPFLYFVSHGDPALVEAVRAGRKEEFAAFSWASAIPDPQDPDSFARSKLNRSRAGDGQHANLRALYRALLQLRREEPLLRPGSATIDVAWDEGEGWVRVDFSPPEFSATARPLCALFRVARDGSVPLPDGSWVPLLTTEEERFGGMRSLVEERAQRSFALAADEAALLAWTS